MRPVKFPGAVLSKNSVMRAMGMQAGAYSPAANPAPATAGFGSGGSVELSNGVPLFCRVRGMLQGDDAKGVVFTTTYQAAAATTESLTFSAALYYVDVSDVTTASFAMIPGTLVALNDSTMGEGSNVLTSRKLLFGSPVEIHANRVVAVGLLATFTSNGVYVWTPHVDGYQQGGGVTGVISGGYLSVAVNTVLSPLTSLPAHMHVKTPFIKGAYGIPGVVVLTHRSAITESVYLI